MENDNDKSILEKITETVKDAAKAATDAVAGAMKTDVPALKADERAVAYMPLAAEGFVSDPLMLTPVAMPRTRKKRAASKRTANAAKSTTVKKAAGKSGRKSAKKAVSKKAAKKTATKSAGKKTGRKTVTKAPKKTAKKAAKRTTKKARKGKRGR